MRSDGRLFWVRATWLLDRLQRGVPTTAADLSAHFGVSRITAYRLCDALRDDFGAPLLYDRSSGSWSLHDPHWELPRLPLSPGEVTALALARGLVSHVTAPGIARDMARFWKKLSMELASQSAQGVAFAQSVTALAPRWTAPSSEVMDTVLRGLALGRQLELDYQSPWSAARVLAPVTIIGSCSHQCHGQRPRQLSGIQTPPVSRHICSACHGLTNPEDRLRLPRTRRFPYRKRVTDCVHRAKGTE